MQIIINNSMEEQKKHGTYAFPVLVSYEVLSKYDSGTFIPHWHSEVELTLITSGEMLYKIGNNVINAEKGDIIFCNSGSLHSGKRCSQSDCSYISITVDPRILYGYKGSQLYEKYIKPVIQDVTCPYIFFRKNEQANNEIALEIRNIEELNISKCNLFEVDMVIALLNIWKHIYKILEKERNYQNIDSDNLSRLRTILNYIDANYSDKIKLSDISKCINLCESECSRLFRKMMKISLFEYIEEYRIKKGAELLQSTDEPIWKISEMVGFNDANNFSRTFHKIMGLSPKKYRNK